MTAKTATDSAAKKARQEQQAKGSNGNTGLLGYIDDVSHAADWIITHPFSSVINTLSAFAAAVTGNHAAFIKADGRLIGWAQANPISALKQWARNQLNALQAQLFKLQVFLLHYIYVSEQRILKLALSAVAHERSRRIAEIKRAEKLARREVAALHSAIEHEAASAYRAGFDGRLSDISRIVEYLAAHNSVTSRLVRDLAAGVLDLASVDDPLARLALGFLLRQLVDRLGVDRLAGAALSDLLSPLLGSPRPNSLPGVIRDVSDRLGALEAQQATFWEHGGSDVEQAGSLWAGITSPLADAAVLAWLAEGVADPVAWADQIADVFNPLLTGVKDVIVAGIREAE